MLQSWLEYHSPPVLLSSGGESRWFVNSETMFRDWALRDVILDYFAKFLTEPARPCWNIVGVSSGGIPWATALAKMVPCATDGWPVVVEDVVTTGKSAHGMTEQLELEGATGKRSLVLAVVVRTAKPEYPPDGAWAWISLPFIST